MNLQERKGLLERLGQLMLSTDPEWEQAKRRAFAENAWFIPEFIELASTKMAQEYLLDGPLNQLIETYGLPPNPVQPKTVGIVMAGNIPMVGLHDLICVFLTGHYAQVKLSSKDEVLLPFLIKKMIAWQPQATSYLNISTMLKGCDAYIATGSNNSSRYFDYYFRNRPHLIRRNRTSVAILSGQESREELERLADDVYLYFGLGCRNVTKLFVPEGYDFRPLLDAFKKYDHLMDYSRYKNNYDYNLAILILNKSYYMSNGSVLLVEAPSSFSPIGQLNYEYYTDSKGLSEKLKEDEQIQCVVGKGAVYFGKAQSPAVCDFADGVDTMEFLLNLS